MRPLFSILAALAVAALALPTLAQQQALLRFSGQLLDVRGGYVYFTTGDAFKLCSSDIPNVPAITAWLPQSTNILALVRGICTE